MQIIVLPDVNAVALEAASMVAAEARAVIAARGRFIAAFSGGRTPWLMLSALAKEELPWENVHIVQVDERVAPPGSPDRNLTHLRESLFNHTLMRSDHIYPMPVEEPDLDSAAKQYEQTLQNLAGSPPLLDLVHLGLGPDGHTASLAPGDPVLDFADADVSVTGLYQGTRRMTLTFPIINRALRVLWLVTGSDKAEMLVRLSDEDQSIPAGRVRQDSALVLTDRAAAAKLGPDTRLEFKP